MVTKAAWFVPRLLASFFLILAGTAAPTADEFHTPAVTAVRVEWHGVLDQLRSEIGTQPAVAPAFTFSGQRRPPAFDPRSTPALVQLNAVTSQIFTGIGRSPIPVLLPFDTAAYLRDAALELTTTDLLADVSVEGTARRLPVRQSRGGRV